MTGIVIREVPFEKGQGHVMQTLPGAGAVVRTIRGGAARTLRQINEETAMASPEPSAEYEAAQRAWQDAGLSPLWESAVAFSERPVALAPLFWQWSAMRPLIDRAIELVSPRDVERRVLMFTDPSLNASRRATTTKGLNAGLQILLPGEFARPHRHTMDAFRFILEGEGAATVVEGKEYPMAEGDLVLTPGWCWHEHVHRGTHPVIWLDGLNSPLHRYLGTAEFQSGPTGPLAPSVPDAAFQVPNILPEGATGGTPHSPVFRYAYAAASAALDATPPARDGSRRVRYVNPTTGGPAMALIDHRLVQLDPEATTIPYRSTANAICVGVEGHGSSTIGNETFAWGPKDVFTMPQGNWIVHRAGSQRARFFTYSDAEVFARLGLLREEYGNSLA
jgi:gentisate 1,2-dioxygenase